MALDQVLVVCITNCPKMDQLFDLRTCDILWSAFSHVKEEVRQSVKLITVFGKNGSELIYVTNDDNVYVFGSNRRGCLGLGSEKPQLDVPRLNITLSGKRLVNIFTGLDHCIGLTADGKCYGWGYNDFGRLGIGNAANAFTPQLIEGMANKTVIQVSCGSSHTLVITSDRNVHSWGRNHFGQLGLNHMKHRYFPNSVIINHKHEVELIACGFHHSVALTQTGKVFVWGLNDTGQLGLHVDQVNKNDMKKPCVNKPQILDFPDAMSFKSVVCGKNYTILLTTDGNIYAFGSNSNGQIGVGTVGGWKSYPFQIPFSEKYIDIMADKENNISMAITKENKIHVWGFANKQQMPTPRLVPDFVGRSVYEVYMKLVQCKTFFKTVLIGEQANKMMQQLKECRANLNEKDRSAQNNRKFNRYNRRNDNTERNVMVNASCNLTADEVKKNENISIKTDNQTPALNGNLLDDDLESMLKRDENANKASEAKINSSVEKKSDDNYDDNMKKDQSIADKDLESESVCDDYSSVCSYFDEMPTPSIFGAKSGEKFMRILNDSFNKKSDADLMFFFSNEKTIYCHKTILQIRNKKFWAKCVQCMKSNQDKEAATSDPKSENLSSISILKTYSYHSFRTFLRHLYGFEPELELKWIEEVLKLANIYEEPELRDLCLEYLELLEGGINLTNVCKYYQRAINKDLELLKKFCVEFAANNWKNICKSDEFQALDEKLSERFMTDIFKFKSK